MSVEDHYAHRPLPYVVTLRMVASEDGVAEHFERRVVAYSLYEAMFAAVVEATGSASLDGAKCVVESVRPDVPAYDRIMQTLADLAKIAEKFGKKP